MQAAPAGQVTKHSEEDSVKEFTFNFQKCCTQHVARGKLDDNLYSVLMSSEAFKEEQGKNEGKIFDFIGKKEVEGSVNLGMPCKYLPDNAHFEVIFSRENNELYYRADSSSSTKCVTFYIRSTGKSAGNYGTAPKPIIRSESLRRSGHDLCVYAFAGETIREAVCKDGRFLPKLEKLQWNLMEGQKSWQSTHTVNKLYNKHFELKLSSKIFKAGNKADNTSPKEKQAEENVPGEGNDLLRELVEQVDQSLGKRKGTKKGIGKNWDLLKVEFGKVTSDGVPITVHEMLVRLSGAVGFIKWDNNGIKGAASCFHLGGGRILTCYHVVKMIVGDGAPENEWEAIIAKSTQVTFTYKEDNPTGGWYEVKPWFKVYSSDLDYAVLRLRDDQRSQLPPAVSPTVNPPPSNGVVYIIGHPDGARKSTDTCIVISHGQRNVGYYVQVFTKYSFQEIKSPDRITYNTCFFHGASGSPVFNSFGQLVGMHAGGYMYKIGSKMNSVIEFGLAIASIAAHMDKHHREFDRSFFFTSQNETQDKQNVPANDQQEVQMDTE
ncbi:hypothetical protein scyTo_0023650 [Scyliorhinus torazame]|uniref:Serine protease n=1 Tax=Scyliorhinus torazame TaxID=75743 RepID=A0A401QCT3_SCYTO|nr:hypothetical protein [Scyliorhinus torazame]